jgi:flagellar hook-associated protein 2
LNGTTEITVANLARSSIATSSTGVASVSSTIASGSGSFSFKIGSGATQTIAVDATTTLQGLATAINALGVGASASVVNLGTDASPDYRLRLAGRDTGTASELSIVADGTTLGVGVTQTALDASFTVSGFATSFTRSSNVINDVIPGVTLNLQHAGGPLTVSVTTDTASVRENVQAVVDSFNDLVAFVNEQSAVSQDTSTDDRSVQAGPLAFDGTVRTALDGLRTAISSTVAGLGGSYSLLADVGLTSTRDGTLQLDGDKLETAIASDESSATKLFSGSGAVGGVFDRVHDYLTGITAAGGLLDVRTKGITASLASLSARIDDGQRQVAAYEQNLRDTFNHLELLVSQLKSQSAFLSSALGKTS